MLECMEKCISPQVFSSWGIKKFEILWATLYKRPYELVCYLQLSEDFQSLHQGQRNVSDHFPGISGDSFWSMIVKSLTRVLARHWNCPPTRFHLVKETSTDIIDVPFRYVSSAFQASLDEPLHDLYFDETKSRQSIHGETKRARYASEACQKRYDHKTCA